MTEKALMYSIGCGDMRAMKHLLDKYLNLVSKTAFRILCDRKDSEAVTRDVFVHAWNYSEKFDASMPLEIWLLRLTSRYARLRVIRRRIMYIFGQRPDLFVTTVPKAADYDDYVTKQAWELFCRALSKAESRFRKELRRYGKPEDYDRYIGFLRKVSEGFTEHDKLKRIIMTSIK